MTNIYYMYDNDKIAKKRQRFYFHFLTMKTKESPAIFLSENKIQETFNKN